jgi:hypothetical protein
MVENPIFTDSYRAIFGTRRGEIYEFWWRWPEHPKIRHRKWKKPTIKKKGNAILFFDAGQKQQ